MPIRRYIASKDTTITNALLDNLIDRATESNMGQSDVLEVFSIYGQSGSNSQELSRILVQFPVDTIISDRQQARIPPSGSVQFVLKLSNTVHPFTLPKEYHLVVNPLSRSWSEGHGLDMESYKDQEASNWISASLGQPWDTEGGDIVSGYEYKQYLEEGTEDLELDITPLVEDWIDGTQPNYGVMIKLSSSYENDTRSYYTKKFFARGSEYFYKKPWIEVRYDATVKDDRGNFYVYNPFVPLEQSKHSLYFYNKFKGHLYDHPIVGQGNIYVKFYPSSGIPTDDTVPLTLLGGDTVVTGSWISTGIYSASLGIQTNLTTVYDFWFTEPNLASSLIGYGGPINLLTPFEEEDFTKDSYVVSIKNLKPKYSNDENARMQIFTRPSNWNPNSYTSVVSAPTPYIIEDMYYTVYRIADGLEVIPYGTGSMNHTRLSFDKSGNYFDLDMSLLEPGYSYGIKFKIFDTNEYYENREVFKFRVEE